MFHLLLSSYMHICVSEVGGSETNREIVSFRSCVRANGRGEAACGRETMCLPIAGDPRLAKCSVPPVPPLLAVPLMLLAWCPVVSPLKWCSFLTASRDLGRTGARSGTQRVTSTRFRPRKPTILQIQCKSSAQFISWRPPVSLAPPLLFLYEFLENS